MRSRPYTRNGWRPISVTYQPATVATQPEKVIATSTRSSHGAHGAAAAQLPGAEPRHSQHQHAHADHDAKAAEHRRHRRVVRELVQALDLAVEVVGQDQAAQPWGSPISKSVAARPPRPARRTAAAARRARSPRCLPSPRSSPAGARACSGRAGRRRRSAPGSAAPPRSRRCAARRVTSSPRSPRSNRQADSPAIRKRTVSAEASSMCVSRYGNDGLKITLHQLGHVRTGRRSSRSPPASASTSSAPGSRTPRRGAEGDEERRQQVHALADRRRPNSMMPRKPASRKNAVSTS